MPFLDDLKQYFKTEEQETVGKAFGGNQPVIRKSYSVTSIRDWIIGQDFQYGDSPADHALSRAVQIFPVDVFKIIVANLIRFSFLIELTNLKVGSTKMKTRWVPGLIQMPQEGSFEPIQGSFEPGNDPRAATFEECAMIFSMLCNELCEQAENDPSIPQFIKSLNDCRRVPYEFPFTYSNPNAEPIHTPENVEFWVPDSLSWLLKARIILDNAPQEHKDALKEIKKAKMQVKVYKTDRALTGKDKTNRAKRWEVLAGDFQHATLSQCWSVEKKLTSDLVLFEDFPTQIKDQFIEQGLLTGEEPISRCPVTLELLNYTQLAAAILNHTHGVSDYQIGHLHPLKRGGSHEGDNVCWQSADGNRIQGSLSMEETEQLLIGIIQRRQELL
jgi:hypothetical protein